MNDQPGLAQKLYLPSDASIAEIRDLLQDVRRALDRPGSLEIDASAVSKADLTSIQLLISAMKTGQQKNRAVRVSEISPRLADVFERAGFPRDANFGELLLQEVDHQHGNDTDRGRLAQHASDDQNGAGAHGA